MEERAGWLWQDSELVREDTSGTGGMRAASSPACLADAVIGSAEPPTEWQLKALLPADSGSPQLPTHKS